MVTTVLGVLLAALAAGGALALARAPAAGVWIFAWILLLFSGAAAEVPSELAWLAVPGALAGSLFAALLLAGARDLADRRPLVWLVPVGIAFGALRALAEHQGAEPVATAVASVFDPALVLAAAWVVAPRRGALPNLTLRLLSLTLAVVGVLEILSGLSSSLQGDGLILAYAVVVPATWMLQVAALGERVRRAQVREGDLRFRTLTENVRELVAELDEDGHILYAGPRHSEMGLDITVLTGEFGPGLFEGARREAATRLIRDVARGAEIEPFVWRVEALGRTRWFETSMRGFRTSTGERRVVTSSRDVTERRRTEKELEAVRHSLEERVEERTEALRVSEERYRRIAELNSDYSYATRIFEDGRFEIEWLSAGFERLLGWTRDDVQADFWERILHPDDRELLLERQGALFASGTGSMEHVYRLRDKSGQTHRVRERVLMETDAAGVRAFGAGVDITEEHRADERQRRLEHRLAEAQRHESLGLMASGIAHDFNNLLMPILGHSVMALGEVEADSTVRERLQRIRRASEYAGGLVRQLLTYAGSATTAREAIDLSSLVEDMIVLIDTAVSKRGSLRTDLASELPSLRGDPTQLRQVTLNLITNAAEALGDEGGTIQVRTGWLEADHDLLARSVLGDELEPGRYLVLEVRDDGCGMDGENLRRIFDPFFTTKFSGRGLGLAAVLGIVRGHAGAILVESEAGKGTRMRVLFPVATGAVAETTAPATATEPGLTGTVLVVDDEEPVREIAGEYLERAGFHVLEARSGREAREILDARRGEIDLVLLDLVMPGEGGAEVLTSLAARYPDLPVVLASGHSEEHAAARDGSQRAAGFVQKPYGPEELLEVLSTVLRREVSGPGSSSGTPDRG